MDVIEIQNFKKSYEGKVVHRNINLSVKKGECLGLLGGSGAGKSVILRSLIGLEKPDGGKVIINGEDISDFSEKELIPIRTKVAYVFQGGALFDSMSVFDNLAYPLREHTDMDDQQISVRIKEQLEEFGLGGNEDVFPAELSGGMQKRVGLARAIISQPEFILYDEPTAGLDPFNTKKIQEMILRLKEKGRTSIFVTHDMPSALAVCDRLALILKGEIVAVGTLDDLQRDPNGVLHRFMDGHFA